MLSRHAIRINGNVPQPNALSNVEQHSWLGYYLLPVPGIAGEGDSGSGQVPDAAQQARSELERWQGRERNDWRDEQPGRMLHEAHTGPLEILNFNPRARSYSSITTSAFYPVVLAELWHWTGNRDLVRAHIDAARRSLSGSTTTATPSARVSTRTRRAPRMASGIRRGRIPETPSCTKTALRWIRRSRPGWRT